MKVSIITLHKVFNFGSVLQAYATQLFFERLGYETEVIDYVTESWQNKALFKRRAFENGFLKDNINYLLRIFSVLIKKKTIWGFLKKNVHMTSTYNSLEELKNASLQSDVFCTGSDQVWNSDYCKMNQAFFLQFANKEAKRISFAASIGKTNISPEEKSVMKEYLKDYSLITVRESQSVDTLQSMGLDSKAVLDPTLMIEKEHWISLASKRLVKDKYLILMLLYNEDNNATEIARKIADEKGLKLVKISWELKKPPLVDILMTHRTPEDFLSLFYYADYVVTNSFHGLAFSINLNKQFTVIKRDEFNLRIDSLLELTGLEDRLVDGNGDIYITDKKIDYTDINEILKNQRKFVERIIREDIDGK